MGNGSPFAAGVDGPATREAMAPSRRRVGSRVVHSRKAEESLDPVDPLSRVNTRAASPSDARDPGKAGPKSPPDGPG